MRFEFEGLGHRGDKTLTLTKATKMDIVAVSCNAPWVLVRLPAGEYQAAANLPGGGVETRWIDIPPEGLAQPIVFPFGHSYLRTFQRG